MRERQTATEIKYAWMEELKENAKIAMNDPNWNKYVTPNTCFSTTSSVLICNNADNISVGYEYFKRRNLMTLFKVYVVDRVSGKLMNEYTLVGNDKEDAALELTLTEEEKALKAEDDLDIVWQSVGQFEKRIIDRVKQV